jgi:signal transduction histidine kinase
VTAVDLIQLASQSVFVLVFALTATAAVRRPEPARVDTALFFGAVTFAILQGRLAALIGPLPLIVTEISTIAVMAMPFFLLRLLDDFDGVPRRVTGAALAGLVLTVALILVTPPPLPTAVVLVLISYFVIVAVYAVFGFVRLARSTTGITRRRMEAVSIGSGLLVLLIFLAGVFRLVPIPAGLTTAATQTLVLASALAYYAGFATPNWLRRFWREPELRAFLERAAELPRLPDTDSIVAEIERHVGASLGSRAAVGLWDAPAGVLRFRHLHDALPDTIGPSDFPTWRVFDSQVPTYFADAAQVNKDMAGAYRASGVGSMLVAPITAGERRVGVLAAYANRRPIFSDEDLAYVHLLADQAAVVLESRALIDEATRVRAQEEATRMKEDFISAAAHDLRTPLTTLLGQAEILERKFRDDPERKLEHTGVSRMVRTSTQLADLVQDLLEAARLEQGRVELHAESTDLASLAIEVAAHQANADDRLTVEASEPVVADVDATRIRQVLRNLFENALKYSPGGAPVTVRVWVEGHEGRIAVEDRGIGIPESDLPELFGRFRRASNVDDRRFAGMGLGLYICREVVARHGGRIWAESTLGSGSTFHVALPLSAGAG